MVLGFKERFKQPILEGKKIHSIREDAHDRWKAGNLIHAATGVRTSKYDCFLTGVCVSVQYVFMTYYFGRLEVSIGSDPYCDQYLHHPAIEQLAKNDGFESYQDFADWFIPLIEASADNRFSGKIIHWTDFKY